MSTEKRYFDTKSIAKITSTSASFWNQRRVRGDGPPFLKAGTKVLYELAEVETWLQTRAKHSTSEAS